VALHLYRVVVRGVFDSLDDTGRDRLRGALDAHDIFDSAFTEAGTLTYDHHLHAFNTRFALRADGAPADNLAEVEAVSLARTADLLAELGVTGRDLRVAITDMADVWGSADRRDRLREGRSQDA
jgi:Family of unknown function (DUF6204)